MDNMIPYVKMKDLKKAYNDYIEGEAKKSDELIPTFEELIVTEPIGSDNLLCYLVGECCGTIYIDTDKNVENQLKQHKISFKEFGMFLTFANKNLIADDRTRIVDDRWFISKAIVKLNKNKLL